MAATSRAQRHPNRRSPRRVVIDSLRAAVGRGRATVKRILPINRIRAQAPQQAGVGGNAARRLPTIRHRSVAGIRQLVGQAVTTTRHLPGQGVRQLNRLTRRGHNLGADRTIPAVREPVDRAPTARRRTKGADLRPGRAAGSRPAAVQHTAPTEPERHQAGAKSAKTQGGGRRTRERQAKPRQVKRREDRKQQTVQELRERAREAGIKGRSSMTKEQLIKALRDHR